jgi:penicillin-binding protein 2
MVNVNALEQCVMVSRLANVSRKALLPRLIKSVGGREQPAGSAVADLDIPPEHLEFVRDAMASVVTGGTAAGTAQLNLGPIMMAGKTGTAQMHNYNGGKGVSGTAGAWALRDHAWFVAFAPYDDPKYACAVVVQHGGWGASAAAPIAREIMRTALLKDPDVRERIKNPASFKDPYNIANKSAGGTTEPETVESPPLPTPPPVGPTPVDQ